MRFFRDSTYLIPNIDEKKLINQLGTFLRDLNNNQKFPYKLILSASPYEKGHTFIIEREDISYVQYLYDSFSKFISCAYENYLNKTNKVDKNLVRYFYYTAEPTERACKVIHFYKNVMSIFVHRPADYLKSSWSIDSSARNGQLLSHFRSSYDHDFLKNATGSIRKLNIDFEYTFFLLQKYTNFCEK